MELFDYLDTDIRNLIKYMNLKCKDMTGADAASLFIKEGNELIFKDVIGGEEGLVGKRLSINQGIVGKVITEGKTDLCNEVKKNPYHLGLFDSQTGYKTKNMLTIPIKANGDIIGAIQLLNKKNGFTEVDKIKIEEIIPAFGKLIQYHDNFLGIDELTGLFRKKTFKEKLKNELETLLNFRATNTPEIVLTMYDLDHFKRINDNYGHLNGDEVLRKTTELSKNSFRSRDLHGRFGGEEFLISFANFDNSSKFYKGIINKLDQYRINLSKTNFYFKNIHTGKEEKVNINTSIGVVSSFEVPEIRILKGKSGQVLINKYVKNKLKIIPLLEIYSKFTGLKNGQILYGLESIKDQAEIYSKEINKNLTDILNDEDLKMNLLTDIFIKRADEALYKAKTNGRNQLRIYNS